MQTRLRFLSTLSLRRATIALSFQAIQFLLFLSTLSLRRATFPQLYRGRYTGYFYPRSPCGERPAYVELGTGIYYISIHALLAESDVRAGRPCSFRAISIHALLAESDAEVSTMQGLNVISIHALLAESDNIFYQPKRALVTFLSTLSLRRATGNSIDTSRHPAHISIHALLAESDVSSMLYDTTSLIFLSTLSLRRATILVFCGPQGSGISIHALLAESDVPSVPQKSYLHPSFLSTLSLRRATR